jgi:hypothetical protein
VDRSDSDLADGILLKCGGEILGVAEFEAVRGVLGSELVEAPSVYATRLLGRAFPARWQSKMGLVPWRHREA